LITLVLAFGAVLLYVIQQPKVYQASMKIVVGQGQGTFFPEAGNVAEPFTQTMSELLASEIVAREALRGLSFRMSPDTLLENLQVSTKPATAVLNVTYDDTDSSRAREILQATGDAFVRLLDEQLNSQTRVDGSVAVSATVFDPAHLLSEPVSPKPALTLSVALVLGLVVGLVTALALEQLDNALRSIEEAETAFGHETSAVLPPGIVGRSVDHSDSHDDSRGLATRQLLLQKLRSGVLWAPYSSEVRSLLVTSAGYEEGKSTIAANLAFDLASQGYKAILVGADARRPSLDHFLPLAGEVNAVKLSSLAFDKEALSRALVHVPLQGREPKPVWGDARSGRNAEAPSSDEAGGPNLTGRLSVILSLGERQLTPDGAKLVTSKLKELADYVIYDMRPLLESTDAYPMVPAVDLVLAVVRQRKSTWAATDELRKTIRQLGARRVKLILTDAEAFSKSMSQHA